MVKLEAPERLLNYIHNWCKSTTRWRGCLVVGPFPYDRFIEGPILWTWQGYDGKYYCIVTGAHDIASDLKEKLLLKEREPPDMKLRDKVRLGKAVLDTSALISGLALKLIEIGLLRGSEIIVPHAALLEIHRLDEEGKQLERSGKDQKRGRKQREKSRIGLNNLNRLKSRHDERHIELVLDIRSREAEKSFDYFARVLEKDIRAAVMDEMIRLTAERKGALLLTGDKSLAARAIDSNLEVILLPGDNRVAQLKAYHMPIWKLHLLSMLLLIEKKELIVKILHKGGVPRKYKLSIKEDEDKLAIEELR